MLESGTRLGPYEILSAAGAGGMGEVYRARDTRLDRIVAIKVLAKNLSGRPEVLQRFEREARTISTLNHPNICTLYDVGTENGVPYLVMEYVEGETLAERLTRGPLPLDDAWRVAIQMGEALDQAHRRGIVHRDLKPGNVMMAGAKGSTTVKLLDFGLAKFSEASSGVSAAGGQTSLPTVAQTLTTEGSIVGTFQYMAPEQLEGKEADARSDIFAFGAVLYEMVTGRKAFQGNSQASLISAIMKDEPAPLSTLAPMSPPALDRVIRQCLAKDPEDRWQTVRDLVRELRWISESSSVGGAAPAVVARRQKRLGAASLAAMLFGVGFVALAMVHFREKTPVEHTARFLLPLPEKAVFRVYDQPVLSPDGTRIVFSAGDGTGNVGALFVRSLDSVEARRLPGTESAYFPFWSPDGRFVAFSSRGVLKKLDLMGGSAITIFDQGTPSCCVAAWNRDGTILFGGATGGLRRVSAGGGTPTPVTRPDTSKGEINHGWPSFLPDGDHFLFTVSASRPEIRGVYLGSLSSAPIRRILPDDSNAQYSPAGYVVFARNNNLMAQPFDAQRLRLSGDPFPIAEKVASFTSPTGAAYSVAGSSLVYRIGSGLSDSQLEWRDRKGDRVGAVGPPADYSNPALSPDGRILAVGKRDPATKTRDIWLFDLTRGTNTRFTFDPADDFNPVWSPDGQRILFSSDRKGHRDLWQKAASGVGQEELVLESGDEKAVEDWTHDGRTIVFNNLVPGGRREVWTVPLTGGRKPSPMIAGPGAIAEGHVSPNGKWIAYSSTESGVYEIYVQNFPPAGGRWQISTEGGNEPQWNSNGKELFYRNGSKLMAVDVKTDTDRFEPGTPRLLFEAAMVPHLRNTYVVAPDGQKFLVIVRAQSTDILPMTMVLNWPAEVRR